MFDDERRQEDEKPHDVLAAEEFAIGARDATSLPPDPAAFDEPHDVLAAEEFAMPAGAELHHQRGAGLKGWLPLIAIAALVLVWLARRR
jgi:hypothetical protein